MQKDHAKMAQMKNWITVSMDGVIVGVDDETSHAQGVEVNMPLHRFIHINDQIAWLSFLSDLRNGYQPEPVMLRLQKKHEMRFIDVTLVYTKTHNDAFCLELQYKNNQVINPLYAAAHELRTPLNSIIGFSDLMLYSLHDEQKMRSYVDNVKFASQHLLNVVEAILQKTEIENENIINCDVVHAIHDSLSMFVSIQGKKTITFTSQYDSLFATIDDTAFRQIIFNLIANALKFTTEFGKVNIYADVLDGQTLCLRVEDDGCGMDALDMAQITQPFKRSAPARQNKVQGNGLGLSLVHNLVQRFNGTLSFASEVNKGTVVTITLPLADMNTIYSSDVIDFVEAQNFSLNKTVIDNDKDNEKNENTRQTA